MDERRDARPVGHRRENGRKRKTYLIALDRRRHPRRALRRLRAQREHRRLPAGPPAGDPAPRHPEASVRGQRRRLSLATTSSLVCAKLGITLIHARPYQPQAKGKQERWFRTVRMQLLPTLIEADTKSLDALNRRLWAWVEGEYHTSPHRGLDGEHAARPLDDVRPRRAARGPGLRPRRSLSLRAEAQGPEGPHVSLNGVVYEVDAVARRRDGHPALRSVAPRPARGRLLQGPQDRAGQARRSLRQLLRPTRPHHQGAPPRPPARGSAAPACPCAI